MLLVDEAYRGRGLGKAGFSAALRDVADFPLVGLDATDLGEPIYLRKGFQTICPIVRWMGVPHALMPRDPSPHFGLNEGIFPLDARCSGFDRSMLLKDLEASGAVVLQHSGRQRHSSLWHSPRRKNCRASRTCCGVVPGVLPFDFECRPSFAKGSQWFVTRSQARPERS